MAAGRVSETKKLAGTAANSEIDEETLVKLRGLCVDEVKRIRGAVSFDDAYKFQKG